jgi:hypothetical protein
MPPSLNDVPVPPLTAMQQPKFNGTKLAGAPSCCVSGIDAASSTAAEMSKVENPSLQVTKDHTLKMVAAPIFQPGPKDVLLHIKVTGVCGYVFPTTVWKFRR